MCRGSVNVSSDYGMYQRPWCIRAYYLSVMVLMKGQNTVRPAGVQA